MSRSTHPATRATRAAANAAALAVVVFALLWLVSTQIGAIRELSPFADDPWDAVATYAAVFLPFVAGPTWIRSLAHRGSVLPIATARRIRWGAGLAAVIVLATSAADLHAIVTVGFAANAGPAGAALTLLVAGALAASATAIILDFRAARRDLRDLRVIDRFEPDVVDDVIDLAAEAAQAMRLGRPVDRFGEATERWLDRSSFSPRMHRLLFGVALAVGAAVAFDTWHVFREGPWANAQVPLVFGALIASGVFAIYLGTVGPLRLLRPPKADRGVAMIAQADAPE